MLLNQMHATSFVRNEAIEDVTLHVASDIEQVVHAYFNDE